MFLSVIPPFLTRGGGLLFREILIAQMAHLPEGELTVLADARYFDKAHYTFPLTPLLGDRAGSVTEAQFDAITKYTFPDALWPQLETRYGDHLGLLKALPVSAVEAISDAFAPILDRIIAEQGPIEAILLWWGMPAIRQVAEARGIPVIHNENGPLRAPLYRQTAFFDRHGISTDTTPEHEWMQHPESLAVQMQGFSLLSAEELRALFASPDARSRFAQPQSRAYQGVALQVEDDSATIAHGNGYSALSLIYEVANRVAPSQMLIRNHPCALFPYHGPTHNPLHFGTIDASADSVDFLARLDHLHTINSSIAVEACLWDVPFTLRGNSSIAPFASNARVTDEAPDLWRNAYFLSYLLPAGLLYDADYYRWRLAALPTLAELAAKHLAYYRTA